MRIRPSLGPLRPLISECFPSRLVNDVSDDGDNATMIKRELARTEYRPCAASVFASYHDDAF
jgi:hypothetical protein